MDLNAVPPPPLCSQDSLLERDENKSIAASQGTELQSKSSAANDNQIKLAIAHSPVPNGEKNTITSCTHKTPVSITKCILTVQNEVDPTNNNDLSSPRTPSNNIASPDFLEYIRSTEKELDVLLKEALASLVSSIRNNNDSMDMSLEASLDELKKDFSFQDHMNIDFKEESIESKYNDDTIAAHSLDMKMKVHPDNVKLKVPSTSGTETPRTANVSPASADSSTSHDTRGNIPIVYNDLRGRKIHLMHKTVLLWCFMMAALPFLLGSIYPASPLLPSEKMNGQIHWTIYAIQRFQLGLASVSFSVATSIRTIMLTPLQRLDAKLKTNGMDFQVLSGVLNLYNDLAATIEKRSYDVWENTARQNHVLKDDSLQTSFVQPPELDLGMSVPCDVSEARIYITDHLRNLKSEYNCSCFLRDVITHPILLEFAAINFDSEFSLATHPLILRNLWPKESFHENSDNKRRLTLGGIVSDPQLSNFILPNYFSDATRTGYDALVPDSDGTTLLQFVKNIQSGKTPYAKIGTQSIIEEISELRDEIVPLKLAKEMFGWNPWLDELREKALLFFGPTFKRFVQAIPPTTYYPVFIAGLTEDKSVSHSRTDMHTEPIGNIAVQLQGTRTWTLIPGESSGLLRPSVSKHGRGKPHYSAPLSPSPYYCLLNCSYKTRLHLF